MTMYNKLLLQHKLHYHPLDSRVNLTPSDVGEGDLCTRLNLPDGLGATLSGIAGTGLALIQPVHVAAGIPPDAHGQHHTAGEGTAHANGTAESEHGLRAGRLAEFVVDVVDLGVVGHVDGGVLDDDAVLDVLAVDALELAALVGGELGHDGEGLLGVDGHAARVAVVLPLADAVVVVAATRLIADALALALGALALNEAGDVARVRDEGGGAGVGLPDVHLVAARSEVADIGDTLVERREVALRIAVPGAVGRTSGIELALATLSLHLGEIQGTVHAARELGHVHVKGELLADELEHLVGLVVLGEQVDTGEEGLEVIISEHVERDSVTLGNDAIRCVVLDALHDTVLEARLGIRACGGVHTGTDGAAVVLGRIDLVQWPAEGVEHDRRVLGDTAVGLCAAVGGELGVDLLSNWPLGTGDAREGSSESKRQHDESLFSGRRM